MKNKYLKHARISEREFRAILALFCADVEALKASRLAKVNKNTTHRIYSLLRRRVVELANAEAAPFAGCVEVDESYFGPRRVRGIRGRGAARKIPVVGLLKRGGRVICSPLPNCSKAELLKMIKGHVSPVDESIIFTDGWRGYDGLVLEGYRHYRVHHSANEFARGRRHINGIESFWSYAKTRLARLRGIRSDAFFSHLKETEWRFNHRHDNLYQTLLKNLASSPSNLGKTLKINSDAPNHPLKLINNFDLFCTHSPIFGRCLEYYFTHTPAGNKNLRFFKKCSAPQVAPGWELCANPCGVLRISNPKSRTLLALWNVA